MVYPQHSNPETAVSLELVETHVLDFLQQHAAETQRAYLEDLCGFADWLRAMTVVHGMAALLRGGCQHTSDVLAQFVAAHAVDGVVRPLIRRQLTAVRSWLRYAVHAGLIRWRVSAPRVRVMAPRPIEHLSPAAVAQVLHAIATAQPYRRARDIVIIHLLYSLGLRPSEVVALDIADFDERHQRIQVGSTAVVVPEPVWGAVMAWMHHRQRRPGPCIIRVLPDGMLQWTAVSAQHIRHVVATWSRRAGVSANPRRLRQSGIISAASTPHPARQVLHAARIASLPARTIGGAMSDGGCIAADLAIPCESR